MGMAPRAVALLVFTLSCALVTECKSQKAHTHRNSLHKEVSVCHRKSPGYYVDEENPCQLVNYCLPDGTAMRLQCPPGSSVDQLHALCDPKTNETECRNQLRRRRQTPAFHPQIVTLLTRVPNPSASTNFGQQAVGPQPGLFGGPFMLVAEEPQPSSPRRTITIRPRPQHLDNRQSSTTNSENSSGDSGRSEEEERGRRVMDTQFVSFDAPQFRGTINASPDEDRFRDGPPSRSSSSDRPSQQQQQQQPSQQNENDRQDQFFPPPFFNSNPNFPPRPFFSGLPQPLFPSNLNNVQRVQGPIRPGNNFIPNANDNAIVQDVRFPGPPQTQNTNDQRTPSNDENRRPTFRPSRIRPNFQQQQQQQQQAEQQRQQQLLLQQQEERDFQRPFRPAMVHNEQPFHAIPPPVRLQPPQQDFLQEEFQPAIQNPFPTRRPFRLPQTESPPPTTTTTTTPAPQQEFRPQNRFRFGALRPTLDVQRQPTPATLPHTQSQLQPQRRPPQQFQPAPQQQFEQQRPGPQLFQQEQQAQQFQAESPPTQQFEKEQQPQQQQFQRERPQQFLPRRPQFQQQPQFAPQQFQTEPPQPQQFQTEQPQTFQTEAPQTFQTEAQEQFQTETPQQFQTETPQQFQTETPQQFQAERPQLPSRRPQLFQTDRPQQSLAERPQLPPRRPQQFQEPQQFEQVDQPFQPQPDPQEPDPPPTRGRGRFRPSFQDEEFFTTTPQSTFPSTDNPEVTGLAPVTDDFGFKVDIPPAQPTPPSFPTTFSDEITPQRPSTNFEDYSDFSDEPQTTESQFTADLGFDETTVPLIETTTQIAETLAFEETETTEEPTTQEVTTPLPEETTTLRPGRIRRPLSPRLRQRFRTTTSTELSQTESSDSHQEEATTSSPVAGGPRRRIRPFARRRRPFMTPNVTTASSGITVQEVTTARPARRRRPLSALMAARRRKPIVDDSETAASTVLATSTVTEDTFTTVTDVEDEITTEGPFAEETGQTEQTQEVTTITTTATTVAPDEGESKDKSRLRNLFSRRFVLKKPKARPLIAR